MSVLNDKWLSRLNSELSEPKIRLICFPFAGGGTLNYSKWKNDLKEGIELYGVNLPGRERFFGEPFLNNYHALIKYLASTLQISACPLIFFGHSFGGLTAYFTALELSKRGIQIPQIFISARVPPHILSKIKISGLNDQDFKEFLIENYQGIPQQILNYPDYLAVFLNIIRQDFKMYEQYPEVLASYENQIISSNMTTIGFLSDKLEQKSLLQWKKYTRGIYNHIKLPGGHFEILTDWKAIVTQINQSTISL